MGVGSPIRPNKDSSLAPTTAYWGLSCPYWEPSPLSLGPFKGIGLKLSLSKSEEEYPPGSPQHHAAAAPNRGSLLLLEPEIRLEAAGASVGVRQVVAVHDPTAGCWGCLATKRTYCLRSSSCAYPPDIGFVGTVLPIMSA